MNFEEDKEHITGSTKEDMTGDGEVNGTQLWYIMEPFDEEIEIYCKNLLRIIMDIVGKEIMRQGIVFLGMWDRLL